MLRAAREETAKEQPPRVKCKDYLDTLMFCYSPANQVSTYYRKGEVDSCSWELSAFIKCNKLKLTTLAVEDRWETYKELMKVDDQPTKDVWEIRKIVKKVEE